MQYLKHFCVYKLWKIGDHNLKKLCPFHVLCLERVCRRKVGSWPWTRIFFHSLAWNVVCSTRPLLEILIDLMVRTTFFLLEHLVLQKLIAN